MGELRDALNDAWKKLDAQIDTYNSSLDDMREEIETAVEEYNSAIAEAREFRDEIVQDIEDYMSERSDKWQESDKAEQYRAWQSEWEGIELDEMEFEMPDPLESPNIADDIFEGVNEDVAEVMA